MAGIDSGTGSAGSSFTHYNYPGVYTTDDFHYCGTPGNDIQNWSDPTQVQTCELANLADLKTESAKVQATLVAYTNQLIDFGVVGFRVDASKHIPVDHQKQIIKQLKKQGLYYTHEVVYEGGAGITSGDYIGLGDVQEFRYVTLMRDAFTGNNIAQLKGLSSKGWLPSGNANVFVANHDRERSGYLSYKSGNNQYALAHVFSLSYPYGTPTVFSGYTFANSDDGAPNGNYGTCSGNAGANGWQCQHRWTAISGMVGFYNKVGSAGLTNWTQGNNNQIAYGRGTAGYVIINNDSAAWTKTFTTQLPAGKYCDVYSGNKSGTKCTGKTITVSSTGKLTNLSVAGHSAVAIHSGSKL
ncbi:hypothetical protein FRB90_006299 [Tulasnella sp. 427]|nr:hypothetical protein FRB90_006299 [Tulasnella sp. 427]